MLTIPKSSRITKERHHDLIRVEDPPKFRLSDMDSSISPQYRSKTFFVNNPESPSVTIGTQPSNLICTPANVITAQNCISLRQKRCSIQTPPMYSIIRREDPIRSTDEHEISLKKTITISDSDNSDDIEKELIIADSAGSALSKLDASLDESLPPQSSPASDLENDGKSPNNRAIGRQYEEEVGPLDMPPRPNSEPLFLAPAIVELRPFSAEPSVDAPHPIKKPMSNFRQATVCKTPRCARPTKAWLARVETRKHEEPQKARPPGNTRSSEERRAVWERLWAAGVNRQHGEDK